MDRRTYFADVVKASGEEFERVDILASYENFERNWGRFPFDQIFRFEIPGILCDEWNSIFQFVGLTNPRSSGSKFRAKIRDQTVCSFTFVYLLWGCSTTLKLK